MHQLEQRLWLPKRVVTLTRSGRSLQAKCRFLVSLADTSCRDRRNDLSVMTIEHLLGTTSYLLPRIRVRQLFYVWNRYRYIVAHLSGFLPFFLHSTCVDTCWS